MCVYSSKREKKTLELEIVSENANNSKIEYNHINSRLKISLSLHLFPYIIYQTIKSSFAIAWA